MSGKWTAIVALTQWAPSVMYVITGAYLLAAIWLIPALMWTWLAYNKLRDEYGVR